MKQLIFNYDPSIFQCKLKKKTLLGKQTRYIYVFEDKIWFNKDENKGTPARIVPYEEVIKIQWNFAFDQKTKKQYIKSFTLYTFKEESKYYGDFEMMYALKRILAKFISQANIKDEYQQEDILGEGSYAAVFQLKQISTDFKFAGKCVEKQKLQLIDKGMKAIQNEIEIMRILSPHSQIVNLHEVYDGENTIYIVMDLCLGNNLQSELKKRSNILDNSEIKILMSNLLSAIEYIHSKGIMHRDLKPENILFQRKNDFSSLKIGDFGLAAICNQAPYLYPKCGTPGYVAPEVANLIDKTIEYSKICDIFSCGAIFHLLLLGEGLFPGTGHLELLKLNKECQINPDDEKYNCLTIEEKDLMFKMLKTNPDHRPNAHDLLQHPYFTNQKLAQMGIFSTNFIQYEDDETLVMQDEIHSPQKRSLEKRFSFLTLSNQRDNHPKVE